MNRPLPIGRVYPASGGIPLSDVLRTLRCLEALRKPDQCPECGATMKHGKCTQPARHGMSLTDMAEELRDMAKAAGNE